MSQASTRSLRILCAFDSWSGFQTAAAASTRFAEALRAAGHRATACPLGDGGDGTGDVLRGAGLAWSVERQISGPTGAVIAARIWPLHLGGVFVESAQAVGRPLCPDPQTPLAVTSYGLGELLTRAAGGEPGPMIVGLGGSGTMDGGLGMAQALGLTALDDDGAPLPRGAGAWALERVAALEGRPAIQDRVLQAWCDVDAPLAGSAQLFGAQKGATPDEIARVGRGLARWAGAVNRWRAARGQPPFDPERPGAGAAGGLGFALGALLGASLRRGAERACDAVGLDAQLQGVDAVVTGEGRLDPTSFSGKVVGQVIDRARRAGVRRVIAVAGQAHSDLPPPPEGPDQVVSCQDLPGPDRAARYRAALEVVATGLRSG